MNEKCGKPIYGNGVTRTNISPCEWHLRDDDTCPNETSHLPNPEDMRTPELVQAFVDNRTAWARGDECTWFQHDRHKSVVTELRRRGVLD